MLVIGENIVNGTLVVVSVGSDGKTSVAFPSFVDETNTALVISFDAGVPLAVISGIVATIVAAGNPF
jgi:hypothetical protein